MSNAEQEEDANDAEAEQDESNEDEEGTTVLHLDLEGLFLDLLGLEVDLNEVVLDISAVSGPGNLLGNLLDAVAGLLDGDLMPSLPDSVGDAVSGAFDGLPDANRLREFASGLVPGRLLEGEELEELVEEGELDVDSDELGFGPRVGQAAGAMLGEFIGRTLGGLVLSGGESEASDEEEAGDEDEEGETADEDEEGEQ